MTDSQKRIVAICGPTGFGKSPVFMAGAILSELPTCIVTNSKGLQKQLMDDFSEVGLVDIRGRKNYQCNMKADYTCEEGRSARCMYKGSAACSCSQAEMRAAISSLVVTNYAKWTSAKMFGRGMSHFQQVVFDEAHSSFDALAQSLQVVLHHREIEQDLKLKFPDGEAADDMSEWREWAGPARAVAEAAMLESRERLSEVRDPKPSWVREFLHLSNLTRRLATVATVRPKDWVADTCEGGFQFDPIRPGRYSESSLLLRVPRVIFTSATLRPKTLYMLGLSKESFDFHEFDSDFDPKRCPIYWVPTMRVDKNADDLSLLWALLDRVISRRRDRKGIIHTISYPRAKLVMSRSRFASSMILNERGEPLEEAVERFKRAGPGAILVSPSVSTGYDFPMKDAEWQFICKIPFQDGRAKIVEARQKDDKEFGPHRAAQDLEQMAGRPMRSEDDQCETIIGDNHLEWFYRKFSYLFSRSFKRRFRMVQYLPAPPPALE